MYVQVELAGTATVLLDIVVAAPTAEIADPAEQPAALPPAGIAPPGATTNMPPGNASVNVTALSAALLRFAKLSVKVMGVFAAAGLGEKLLLGDKTESTVMSAEAPSLPMVRALTSELGGILFASDTASLGEDRPRTDHVIVQVPLAAMLVPAGKVIIDAANVVLVSAAGLPPGHCMRGTPTAVTFAGNCSPIEVSATEDAIGFVIVMDTALVVAEGIVVGSNDLLTVKFGRVVT